VPAEIQEKAEPDHIIRMGSWYRQAAVIGRLLSSCTPGAGSLTLCLIWHILRLVTHGDKPLVWLHGEIKTPPLSPTARLEAGYLLRQLRWV